MPATSHLGPFAARALATPLAALIARLPRGAARAVGAALGEIGRWTDPAGRRAGIAAIAAALPALDRAARASLLRRAYRHQGRMAAERLALERAGPVELCRGLTLAGWEELDRALGGGNPALVCISPVGDPDGAARALALYLDTAGWLEPGALRSAKGDGGGATAGSRPVAATAAVEWLRRRPIVDAILLCAFTPDPGGGRVPLGDAEIGLSARPAELARDAGAVLLTAAAIALPGGRSRLTLEPAIELDPAAAATATLARAWEGVEKRLRRHPEQWPWMAAEWGVE